MVCNVPIYPSCNVAKDILCDITIITQRIPAWQVIHISASPYPLEISINSIKAARQVYFVRTYMPTGEGTFLTIQKEIKSEGLSPLSCG